MIRAIRSELTRLRNPALILGGMGLMVFFGLLSTTILFYTVGSDSNALPNMGGITLAALEASDGMFAGLQNFVGMLGVITLVVWAMGATTDYSSGLIRLLVQAEPSRWRLLLGKVVALTAFTCVSMLVTVADRRACGARHRRHDRHLHGRLELRHARRRGRGLPPADPVCAPVGRRRPVRRHGHEEQRYRDRHRDRLPHVDRATCRHAARELGQVAARRGVRRDRLGRELPT